MAPWGPQSEVKVKCLPLVMKHLSSGNTFQYLGMSVFGSRKEKGICLYKCCARGSADTGQWSLGEDGGTDAPRCRHCTFGKCHHAGRGPLSLDALVS